MEVTLRNMLQKYLDIDCQLNQNDPSCSDIQNIECLDLAQVLESFECLLKNLCEFKSKNVNSELGEAIHRADQLEKQLQKAEEDIRNHFKVRNQLKLHIEQKEYSMEGAPALEYSKEYKRYKEMYQESQELQKELSVKLESLGCTNKKLKGKCKELMEEIEKLKTANDNIHEELAKTLLQREKADKFNEELKNKIIELSYRIHDKKDHTRNSNRHSFQSNLKEDSWRSRLSDVRDQNFLRNKTKLIIKKASESPSALSSAKKDLYLVKWISNNNLSTGRRINKRYQR